MKKFCFIFGATDLGDVLYYNLCREGKKTEAFVVDAEYKNEDFHLGIKVVSFEELEKMYKPEQCSMYICIGYNKMNTVRESIYNKLKAKGFEIMSYIHPDACVLSENIGEGTLIFERAVVGPYVKLGICNICYPNSLIAHHTVTGNFNFFAISCSVAGNVKTGNFCFWGNNSTCKDSIKVGDSALIGAGAYADRDIGEYEVLVPSKSVVLDKYKSIDFI